jgi:hypothetical protein
MNLRTLFLLFLLGLLCIGGYLVLGPGSAGVPDSPSVELGDNAKQETGSSEKVPSKVSSDGEQGQVEPASSGSRAAIGTSNAPAEKPPGVTLIVRVVNESGKWTEVDMLVGNISLVLGDAA